MNTPSAPDLYTLFVNTCDGFEDCWEPFFRLLSEHWVGARPQVLLNTERKKWHYPGWKISSAQVSLSEEVGLPWGECLSRGLRRVVTPLVLYMQEDYFTKAVVRTDVIERFARMMIDTPKIRHIGLTHFGSGGPMRKSENEDLWEICQTAPYRISAQAGFWRTDTLLSYARKDETAWEFEILGTLRSWRRKELFLTANRDRFNPSSGAILEYDHTGIIRGRWHPSVPEFFARKQITVDFAKRGIYEQPSAIRRKWQTFKTVTRKPGRFLRTLVTGR